MKALTERTPQWYSRYNTPFKEHAVKGWKSALRLIAMVKAAELKQAAKEAAAEVKQAAEVEQAAIELATIVHSEGVVIDVAYKVAAADVKAYMELAESHGHMITATEAEERLRWELEFADQPERWMGCGDAASPQGKQHRLRSRTKKKKKKKKR